MDVVTFREELQSLFAKARRLHGEWEWQDAWIALLDELLKDYPRGRSWGNAMFEEIPPEMRPVLVCTFALAFT